MGVRLRRIVSIWEGDRLRVSYIFRKNIRRRFELEFLPYFCVLFGFFLVLVNY